MTEPTAAELGEQAAEAVRALNLRTVFDNLPGTVQYDLLGELQAVGFRLAELTQNLSRGLVRSLEEYDVHEDDGSDPADSVASATEHLGHASMLATRLGEELERAQGALRNQSHRGRRSAAEPPQAQIITFPNGGSTA